MPRIKAYGHVQVLCPACVPAVRKRCRNAIVFTGGLGGVFPLYLVLLFLTVSSLHGCSKFGSQAQTDEVRTDWKLGPAADADFNYLLYEELKRSNKNAEAIPALEKTLEYAHSPQLYLELASLYWKSGNTEKARNILKKGVDEFPKERGLYFTLAGLYLAERRYQAAVTTLKDFLQKEPDDLSARQEIAAILIEDKKYADALDTLRTIPEDKRSTVILYQLARASEGLGLHRQAVDYLKKAVKNDPNFVDAWVELAYIYDLLKDYVAAERTYAHILELGDTGQDIRLRIIKLNLKLNNPDRAMEMVNEEDDNPVFLLQAGISFLREGFYSHAARILEPMAKSPDVPGDVNFYLAVLEYEGRKNNKKALEYLNKFPEKDPGYAKILSFKSRILLQDGKPDEALAIALDGQRRFPRESDFRLIEAGIYEERKDYVQAERVLKEALALWPEDTDILYQVGALQDKMGRRAEGLKTMERVIALSPDHAEALNYVGYTLAEEGKDLDRAYLLVQSALKQKPNSGHILDSLAWVYFRAGKIEKAWAEIQRAVAKVDNDPVIWEHYGDIAKALGKKQEARKGYRRALKADHKEAEKINEKLKSL